MTTRRRITKYLAAFLVASLTSLVFAGVAGAVMTKAQFLAKNPGGNYTKYLNYVIKHSENPKVIASAKDLKASGGKAPSSTTSSSTGTKASSSTGTKASSSTGTKATDGAQSSAAKSSSSDAFEETSGLTNGKCLADSEANSNVDGGEQGIYGVCGKKGWLNAFKAELDAFEKKTGVEIPDWAETPDGWAKFIGYEMPEWAKKIHEKNGSPALAGSGPFDYAPKTDAAKLLLLNAAYGLTASTVEEAIDQLQLPMQFAEREQYIQNQSNNWDYVKENTYLHSLNWDASNPEKNLQMMLSKATEALSGGKLDRLQSDFEKQQALVPEWAPEVKEALEAQGVEFRTELLNSPEINLHDPTKPLFPKGSSPTSLFSLGSLQAGENSYLRGLSAEELMLQLAPIVEGIKHRPAGEPVPDELKGGLTFGGGIWVDCSDYVANGCINGKKLQRSSVTQTDSYTRWTALGQPGATGAGQSNGTVTDSVLGWIYEPLTGAFYEDTSGGSPFKGSGVQQQRRSWLTKLMDGTLQPSHFMTPWEQVVEGLLTSRIAVAGYLQKPSHYFTGVYENYNPQNLGSDTIQRLLATMGRGEDAPGYVPPQGSTSGDGDGGSDLSDLGLGDPDLEETLTGEDD